MNGSHLRLASLLTIGFSIVFGALGMIISFISLALSEPDFYLPGVAGLIAGSIWIAGGVIGLAILAAVWKPSSNQ